MQAGDVRAVRWDHRQLLAESFLQFHTRRDDEHEMNVASCAFITSLVALASFARASGDHHAPPPSPVQPRLSPIRVKVQHQGGRTRVLRVNWPGSSSVPLSSSNELLSSIRGAIAQSFGRREGEGSRLFSGDLTTPLSNSRDLAHIMDLQRTGSTRQLEVSLASSSAKETALSRTAQDFFDRGIEFMAREKPVRALGEFERAVLVGPEVAELQYNMGVAAREAGASYLIRAFRHFRRASKLRPDYGEALYNAANLLQSFFKSSEADAIPLYEAALDAFTLSVSGSNRRGDTAENRDGAVRTRSNLALLLSLQGRSAEARRRYWEAINIHDRPEMAHTWKLGLRVQRAAVIPAMHGCQGAQAITRRRIKCELAALLLEIRASSKIQDAGGMPSSLRLRLDDPVSEAAAPSFYLPYMGNGHAFDRHVYDGLSDFFMRSSLEALWPAAPLVGNKDKLRLAEDPEAKDDGTRQQHYSTGLKKRVGFISTYCQSHSSLRVALGVIRHLDPSLFNRTIICLNYRDESSGDSMALELKDAADQVLFLPWVGGKPQGSLQAAQGLIRSLHLDVAVFVEIGSHPLSYFLAFGRFARIQAAFYGHFVTSGAPSIDYFVTSDLFEARSSTNSDKEVEMTELSSHSLAFVEQMVRFSSLATVFPRPPRPDPETVRSIRSRLLANSPTNDNDGGLVLIPHSLFKIHPLMDKLIVDILDAGGASITVAVIGDPNSKWGQILLARLVRAQTRADLSTAEVEADKWSSQATTRSTPAAAGSDCDDLAVLAPDGSQRNASNDAAVDSDVWSSCPLPPAGLVKQPNSLSQLAWIPRQTPENFTALLAAADVVVDSLPVGSGIVAFEALSVCTPVVTWPASILHRRFAAGLLTRLGGGSEPCFGKCIASNATDFVASVAALAGAGAGKHEGGAKERFEGRRGLQAKVRRRICQHPERIFETIDAAEEWSHFLRRL